MADIMGLVADDKPMKITPDMAPRRKDIGKKPFSLSDVPELYLRDIDDAFIKQVFDGKATFDPDVELLGKKTDGQKPLMQIGGRLYRVGQPEVIKRLRNEFESRVKPTPVSDELSEKVKEKEFDYSLPPEIEGVTEPSGLLNEDAEPVESLIDEGVQYTDPSLEDSLGMSIRAGDTDKAMDIIKTILGREEVIKRFQRDLSPEAMTADLVQGANEERAGRAPAMVMTKSGRFGGETKSPDEIERAGQKDVYEMLSGFSNKLRGEADTKFAADKLSLLADSQAQKVIQYGKEIEALDKRFKQKSRELDQADRRIALDTMFKSYNAALGAFNDSVDSYSQIASSMSSNKERKKSGIIKAAARQIARQKKLVDKILKEQGFKIDE